MAEQMAEQKVEQIAEPRAEPRAEQHKRRKVEQLDDSRPAPPLHSEAPPRQVSAIVVGAGPAGLAVVGALLERLGVPVQVARNGNQANGQDGERRGESDGKERVDGVGQTVVAWIDPCFQGGRINRLYREVPSNTKIRRLLPYATAYSPFRDIVNATAAPNPVTNLAAIPLENTCPLSYVGDMLQMLTDGIRLHQRVQAFEGLATAADWDDQTYKWTVTISSTSDAPDAAPNSAPAVHVPAEQVKVTAPLLVFCTGSSPIVIPLLTLVPPPAPTTTVPAYLIHIPAPLPVILDLDIALKPSLLAQRLFRATRLPTSIAVMGSSHSAILVLMNLFQLWKTTHPHLSVLWFSRNSALKYAIEHRDYVQFDNTGLKGDVANFARAQLEGTLLLRPSEAGRMMIRIDCSGGVEAERLALQTYLPGCGYFVQAIGYARDPLPAMRQAVSFDHVTGGFTDLVTGESVQGLYGAGIAFPQRVVDRVGNVEYAVGLGKFLAYINRVLPGWLAASERASAREITNGTCY